MSDANTDRAEQQVGHGAYGPGATTEPTVGRDEVGGEADRSELSSTLPADTDPEVLRNGGPTRTPGIMTTTGGTAGPNSIRPRTNAAPGVKIAPTTTGDATTGGMEMPDRASTSDAGTNAVQ